MSPASISVPTYDQIRLAFDALPTPEAEQGLSYATAELLGESLRIGKAATGYPVLVVEIKQPQDIRRPDRHYANLRLRHARRLRLKDALEIRTYSVLECFARDVALQDWFLRLMPSMCRQIVSAGDGLVLERQIAWLGELFRMFDSVARKDMTGIWAELHLLSRSPDLPAAVAAWHVDGASTHDFTDEGFHIEVKATAGTERQHQFSAAQLQPAGTVLVASHVLSRTDTGPSVLDLYGGLLERLSDNPDACEKLHRQVMTLVGRRLAEADDTRFDPASAAVQLRYYLGDDVPQIRPPFPDGVSSVRFAADVSRVEPMDDDLKLSARLWTMVLPP